MKFKHTGAFLPSDICDTYKDIDEKLEDSNKQNSKIKLLKCEVIKGRVCVYCKVL